MNSEIGGCDCPCRRWALEEVAKVKADNERLRAEAKEQGTQDFTHVLHRATLAEAENERLRADRDGFKDIARNQRKCIEAALALHKSRMGGPFCPECGQKAGKDGYCTSPTVKALKGKP